MKLITPCYCGGASYQSCCEPLHHGVPAPSAEALMRSRYSAYMLGLKAYLVLTWHPKTRPQTLDLEPAKWLGLKILRVQQGEQDAVVEFIARYKVSGKAHKLHEVSRFVLEQGRWCYLDGEEGVVK